MCKWMLLTLLAGLTLSAESLILKTDFNESVPPEWLVARFPLLELSESKLKMTHHKGHASSWGIPVTAADLSISMKFKRPDGDFISLRFEHGFNAHLCRIFIYKDELVLRVDQPEGVKTKHTLILDRKKITLDPTEYHTLSLTVKGQVLTAVIDENIKLSGSHEILSKVKSSVILAMKGGVLEIDSLELKSPKAELPKKVPFSFFKKAKIAVRNSENKESSVGSQKVKVANDSERALGLFNDYVLPAFEKHCYKCHSHEYKKAKGGLVLDSKIGIFGGGDLGPSVVAHNLQKSWLYQAVTWENEDLEMPPKYKLSDDEIAHIKEWIELGAPDPRKGMLEDGEKLHKSTAPKAEDIWSFQAVEKPKVPSVKNSDWPKQKLDFFILSKLEEKGLSPSNFAEASVLLKRIHFVLTGLPPTVTEREQFLKAYKLNQERAVSKLIDRLMSQVQFGERWGRHWMDVARYADVSGATMPKPMRNAWKYRNWIISSFNEDKPWDLFVKEQLAGDLLKSSPQATAYLGIGHVPGADRDKERIKMDTIDEQLDVIGKTFLALTIGCARCHDHKLDPISHKDYYAMAGIFRSTDKAGGFVKDAKKVLDEPIHLRGDVYLYGDIVPRGFLSAIPVKNPPQIPENQSGRIQLAEWLLSEENTHTYRVVVNRVWHHLFGQGIVRTVDNFGSTGDKPSNWKLLDYLALSFRQQHKGSFKSFIKEILLSSTWQQGSELNEKALAIDPNNRLNWRMNPRRLDSEALVDSVKYLAGTLDLSSANSTAPKFKSGNQASTANLKIPERTLSLRAVYWPVFRKDVPVDMDVLSIFGFPDASSPKGQRETVTVPAQSLYLMNSGTIENAAEGMLLKLKSQSSSGNDLISAASRHILGRSLSLEESREAEEFLQNFSADLQSRGRHKDKADEIAMQKVIHALLISNEFMIVE